MVPEAENEIHQCECDNCKTGSEPEIVEHHRQMNLFLSRLNEPQRRWYAGLLSQQPGNPSDCQLAKITGLDEKTIRRGRQELENEQIGLPHERQRQKGGGRHRAEKKTRN